MRVMEMVVGKMMIERTRMMEMLVIWVTVVME